MTIEKVFHVSSNLGTVDNGKTVAPWFPSFAKSTWWYDGKKSTDYFHSTINDDTYIQYGQNLGTVPWASSRFFGQSLTILEEKENDDGSISGRVSVTPNFFNGRKTDFASTVGYQVRYTVKIHGKTVYTFNGSTIDEFTNGKGETVIFDFRVEPEQVYSETCMEVNIVYPNGEYNNSTTRVGVALRNPNPPTYVPYAIRQGGKWKDLDSNKGVIKVRQGGTWVDKSQENNATSLKEGKGHNRIRKQSKWLQAPKMKGSEVI